MYKKLIYIGQFEINLHYILKTISLFSYIAAWAKGILFLGW